MKDKSIFQLISVEKKRVSFQLPTLYMYCVGGRYKLNKPSLGIISTINTVYCIGRRSQQRSPFANASPRNFSIYFGTLFEGGCST